MGRLRGADLALVVLCLPTLAVGVVGLVQFHDAAFAVVAGLAALIIAGVALKGPPTG